jgi:hypothetical protein
VQLILKSVVLVYSSFRFVYLILGIFLVKSCFENVYKSLLNSKAMVDIVCCFD